jgi:hypothetical protein
MPIKNTLIIDLLIDIKQTPILLINLAWESKTGGGNS